VLVVEDDDALRAALRDVLEEAGYGVVCVRDGVDALGVMRREPICFVLLDMHLPTMDGAEFRRHQLGDPALAVVPLAVLTSDARASLGDDVPVLWKPFDVDDLLRVVRACCAAGSVSWAPPARTRGRT
jgi:CheY-like chemotaxis protein